MEKVLVTGGAGFVGSHIVENLARTRSVVILDTMRTAKSQFLNEILNNRGVELIKGSIMNRDEIHHALEGISTVFHLAAQPDVRLSVENPFNDFETNVVGGMNLLEGMREKGVKRILFASSGGTVYGETDKYPTPENTPLNPISNYGAAKAAFEMYLSSYSRLYDMSAVSMRFGNIIGPRLERGVIFDFYMKLKQDSSHLEVWGDGSEMRSLIYIDDVLSAAKLLERTIQPGHLKVNVSSGQCLRIAEIAEIVCEEMNVPKARIEYTETKSESKGNVQRGEIDNSKLRSLGWRPMVSIEDGIRRYVSWLRTAFP